MSLKATLLAIRLLHPELDGLEEAKAIERAAKVAHVSALELVALVEHESHFRRSAVSPDGEDYGLAQVRARHRPACRKDLLSADCRDEKARLQNPAYNLAIIGRTIWHVKKGNAWKKKRSAAVWLAALAGTSNLRHPKVLEVLELQKQIKRASRSGSVAPCICHGGS
jgi:hypothetical protein